MDNKDFLTQFFSDDIYISKESLEEPLIESSPKEEGTPPGKEVVSNKEEVEHIQTPSAFTSSNLPSIGKEGAAIGIFVSDPNHDVISDPNKTFLYKIFQAVQLNPEDIRICNDHKAQGIDATELLNSIDSDIIFSFNATLSEIAPNETRYNLLKLNGKKVILADALEDISSDVVKKKALWSLLQSVFLKN